MNKHMLCAVAGVLCVAPLIGLAVVLLAVILTPARRAFRDNIEIQRLGGTYCHGAVIVLLVLCGVHVPRVSAQTAVTRAPDGQPTNDRVGLDPNPNEPPASAAGSLLLTNTRYASMFPGRSADAKIRDCLNAACPNTQPNRNGTCDASGLTGPQRIEATIAVPPFCTLMLGTGTYLRAVGAQLLYDTNDSIIGQGSGSNGGANQARTLIRGNDAIEGVAAVGGDHNAKGTMFVHLAHFTVDDTSTANSGSVGLALNNLHHSVIEDVTVMNSDTGIKFCSAPHGCFYNQMQAIFVEGANSAGLHLMGDANSNNFTAITIMGVAKTLLRVDSGINNDTFEMLDLEASRASTARTMDIAGWVIKIIGLYEENVTNPDLLEASSSGVRVEGASCGKVIDLAREPFAGNSHLFFCGGRQLAQANVPAFDIVHATVASRPAASRISTIFWQPTGQSH